MKKATKNGIRAAIFMAKEFGGYTSKESELKRFVIGMYGVTIDMPDNLRFDDDKLFSSVSRILEDLIDESENDKLAQSWGLWIDSGKLYIDIVTSCGLASEALNLGNKFDQLEIYDRINCKTIKCRTKTRGLNSGSNGFA